MFGFIRLVVLGFIAMTVVYFAISIYSKSVRRERLEDQFAEDHPDGGAPGARDAYVEQGMVAYKNSIRPKLIALVYAVPIIVMSAIIYIINEN
ncbi:hypothetical protein ACJ5NV_01345 [Loktanella agnita]|uniref:hypothetical protein n=1 Tax=Loktanella agnita TaxID=287097 RepID=UPI0039860217